MYTINDFGEAYEAEDYPNAIAIWDDCAERIFGWTQRQPGPPFRPELPAILSAFMPGSGGSFLTDRMIAAIGYRDCAWGVTRRRKHTEFYPTPEAVRCYRKGGFFSMTRALPSAAFKMVARQTDMGKVWVHLRDPVEAARDMHALGQALAQGRVPESRLAEVRSELVFVGHDHGIDRTDRDSFLRTCIPFLTGWVKAWLDHADAHPDSIVFTFADDMADLAAFFADLYRRYGYLITFAGMIDTREPIPDAAPAALAAPSPAVTERVRATASARRATAAAAESPPATAAADDWTAGLSPATLDQIAAAGVVWQRALARRGR